MAKNFANQDQSREDHRKTETLLSAYLSRTLTVEEQAAFEKEVAEDPFLADALEGLKKDDPETVARSVRQLKKQLDRTVRKKEKTKHRSVVPDGYMYWAVAIILMLAVAAFFVLQLLKHR